MNFNYQQWTLRSRRIGAIGAIGVMHYALVFGYFVYGPAGPVDDPMGMAALMPATIPVLALVCGNVDCSVSEAVRVIYAGAAVNSFLWALALFAVWSLSRATLRGVKRAAEAGRGESVERPTAHQKQ